jgi:glucosamine--fructose-6-phosphate aminotransferase (isomerizing)
MTQSTQHPFHMYDAITAQPQAYADTIKRIRPQAEQIAPRLAQAQRLFLVGIGTSSHAAQVGYHLFRHYGVTIPTQFCHSFDFALYGPELTAHDAVIIVSHRGAKRYGLAAIQRAKEAGCYTLLITGQGEPASMQYADDVFTTTIQDPSSAHTISYTGSQAALAALAEALSAHQSGNRLYPATFLDSELPDILRQCLQKEDQVRTQAAEHLHRRRFWLTGGGPSGITAQEIALKIKETSYLQAEGMPVEVLLHGPLQCVEPEDLFLLIAPAGPAQPRIEELAAMLQDIGAPYLVVADETAGSITPGAVDVIDVPSVPEPFTTLTCLIPLQLLAYHQALLRGTNPDGFRLDDPRFASAFKRIQL